MFDRVVIRASDLASSLRFYATVLPELGGAAETARATVGAGTGAGHTLAPGFVLAAAGAAPATRRLHLGFAAASRQHVAAFWQAGVDAGFVSDGEPGPRPQYSADYHGAFLLDPDGNSIEACVHGRLRAAGRIDHVWLRVGPLAMTRRFYAAAAAQAGGGDPAYAAVPGQDDPARFRGRDGGSLTLVEGPEPTTGLDLTIGAARFVDVDGRSLRLLAAD